VLVELLPSGRRRARAIEGLNIAGAPVYLGESREAELLAVEHLSAGYGPCRRAIGRCLPPGQFDSLAVMGRNGVGKTTLIFSTPQPDRRDAPLRSRSRWAAEREGLPFVLAPETRAALGIGGAQRRNIFRSLSRGSKYRRGGARTVDL